MGNVRGSHALIAGEAHDDERRVRDDAEPAHRSGSPRLPGVVQRQVEVIGGGAIDRAVHVVSVSCGQVDGYASSREVAQHEADRHTLAEGALGGPMLVEAGEHGAVVDGETRDRGEGNQQGRRGSPRLLRYPRDRCDPVDAEGSERHRKPVAVRQVDDRVGVGGAELPETRVQVESGDAEPLGLRIQRGALRLPLRGELALEVVEEAVSVHPTERRGSAGRMYELST